MVCNSKFELNSKQFGKTMIQAIPSNSIFHNEFTVKNCPKMPNNIQIRISIRIPLPRDPPRQRWELPTILEEGSNGLRKAIFRIGTVGLLRCLK